MPGKVLGGRYTVQDRIGTGGMATVYRGVDEVLGRTVAIKTMLPQYASDESFAARFKQEAQAAAALQSPYIVSVYDWGKDGDTYYIVMEYLRGIDLKSGIRRHGALGPQKVAQIGSQIATALSIAHKHDIIHRDIKPQNIMVQQDGNVKVMDFGIARAKNSHLTQDNSVLGTAHYVSPEQTQGKELGPTTDIYSLGVVMYEAATGSVPFDGDDAISVAMKQVSEQPLPPSQLNSAVDPSLEGIILKCMQKDPADRFQTADELGRVLRDYLSGRMQAVNSATAGLSTTRVAPVVDARGTGTITTTAPVSVTGSRSKPITATERARMEAEREQKRRRHRTVLWTLLSIAALGVIAWGIMQFLATRNATRAVPNLLNITQEEALTQIDESDYFARGTVTEEYSSTTESGIVIDQDPKPYRNMPEGTKIDLVVSKGTEPAKSVQVPDLKGKTPAQAEAALAEANLVGVVGDSVFASDVDVNCVAKQIPAAGTTVKEGDSVTYQLSKGAESVEVPDLLGYDYTSATKELEDRGFVVELAYGSSDSYDEGYVMSQSVTGVADKGTTITLTVSTGPEYLDVPYVIGRTVSEATSILEEAGFSVSTTYQETTQSPEGYVIDQSESESATAGTTITLTVSTAPEAEGDGGSGDADTGSDATGNTSG